MACYSDHNEDIRVKGSCDYCRSTEPDLIPAGWASLGDGPELEDVVELPGESRHAGGLVDEPPEFDVQGGL